MRRILTLVGAVAALAAVPAAAAEAANPYGPDYHSNCTAGFAVGSTLDGAPGATELAQVAQPPKQFGSLSDVGFYSSTHCG